MRTEAIKFELHDKIDHADPHQLEDLHQLITNYLKESDKGWDTLTKPMQNKLTQSLEQASMGQGTPAKEAIGELRKKYGLNG